MSNERRDRTIQSGFASPIRTISYRLTIASRVDQTTQSNIHRSLYRDRPWQYLITEILCLGDGGSLLSTLVLGLSGTFHISVDCRLILDVRRSIMP